MVDNEFKQMCEKHNKSINDIVKEFGIPKRTVENWYYGDRKVAPYIIKFIEELIELRKGC